MMGIVRIILPVMPSIPSIGTNAATVVNTAKTTGVPTSRAPSIAPARPRPLFCCRV